MASGFAIRPYRCRYPYQACSKLARYRLVTAEHGDPVFEAPDGYCKEHVIMLRMHLDDPIGLPLEDKRLRGAVMVGVGNNDKA